MDFDPTDTTVKISKTHHRKAAAQAQRYGIKGVKTYLEHLIDLEDEILMPMEEATNCLRAILRNRGGVQ